MRRVLKTLYCLMATLLMPGTLFGGNWPHIERALHNWKGSKQVLLRSAIADPLSSPLVQELLGILLAADYTVKPAGPEAMAHGGLILDMRVAGAVEVVALRQAENDFIIAFERHAATIAPAAAAAVHPAPPSVQASAKPSMASPPAPLVAEPETVPAPACQAASMYGPLELEGRPRRLVAIKGRQVNDLVLGLLYDEKLVACRVEESALSVVGEFSPAIDAKRALHLDAADLNGDGSRELAAVWAEDIFGIYQGTDSRPHAWLLSAELRPLAEDQSGYLRLHDNQAAFQRRGTFKPFQGPVLPFVYRDGAWSVDKEPLAWGGDLFAATPVDDQLAIQGAERENLRLVVRGSGRPLSGGLLENLGSYAGPRLAVPLENPENRYGFGKDDLVREKYHALPARQAKAADGSIYTILRGRSAGLPLLGRPEGQDRLVRVVRRGDRLLLEQPFAGVDAYILDFALLERPDRKPAGVLLLNEREDGSGRARLLIQESAPEPLQSVRQNAG